jgi:hypothetical protein
MEAWVGMKDMNFKGQYDLNLITTLRICDVPAATKLSLSTLKEKLQTALLKIRFQHPDIACTAVWDDQVAPLIQYTPPENCKDALTWAQDTIQIWATPQTGLAVWTEIEKRRRDVGGKFGGKPAKSVSIYTIADVADENTWFTPGTVVDVLMHMNHLYWDGISARMFAGDLLQRLSQSFGVDQRLSQYNWGEEIANLGVPILDTLNIDLSSPGDEFNTAREESIIKLINIKSSWGLKLGVKTGTPRTVFHTFTVLESETIIRAVKSRLGPEYTISHLGHAATVLALLEANPPSNCVPDTQSLLMPFPVNGRRWLRDDYARNQYGAYQAGAVVEFENIKSFMVDGNDKDAVAEALEKGCKLAKKSYNKQLRKSFQLALGVSKYNFLASVLNSNPKEFGGMAVPIFISDGVNDRFISRDIISAASGEKLMSVDNVAFFIDSYLPEILIRMDSWKGASALSLCYNDGSYTDKEATTFLEHIASYMLAFVQQT